MTQTPAPPRDDPSQLTPREAALKAAESLQHAGPGELSALRRLKLGEAPPAVFWKLMAIHLEAVLPAAGAARDDAETRWAIGFSALARLIGSRNRANPGKSLHAPGQPLGKALAQAGLSELRFDRLIRARGAPLHEQVRQAAAFLAAKAEAANGVDLILLVVHEDDSQLRRNISRHFFTSRLSQESKNKDA